MRCGVISDAEDGTRLQERKDGRDGEKGAETWQVRSMLEVVVKERVVG